MIYKIDMGDHFELWSYRSVEAFYRNNIDHSEYKDFEEWRIDMEKQRLMTLIA